jgi:anti-sigma B factor antagonist
MRTESRSHSPRVPPANRTKPPATAFEIAQRDLDARTGIVSVKGEVDLSTAPRLKWALVDSLEAGHGQLVVDLSRVTFIDSTALGVLVGVKRSLGAGALALVCANADVLKIFELSGMDGAFTILPTLREALAHVQAQPAGAS